MFQMAATFPVALFSLKLIDTMKNKREVLTANPVVSLAEIIVRVSAGENEREVQRFDASAVDSLEFRGGDGDDTFRNNTHLESLAYGNGGNDLLVGGYDPDQADIFPSNEVAEEFEVVIEEALEQADAEAVSVEAIDQAMSEFESSEPTLPAANGLVVSDNFQDLEFVPYNLQVRNTTGQALNWQALVSGVNYSEVPNLVPGNYTVTSSENADGTFNHLFSSTEPVAAFQNVVIAGGILPGGFGNGTGLTLFAATA